MAEVGGVAAPGDQSRGISVHSRDGKRIPEWAESHYEAIRELHRITLQVASIDETVAYELLSDLELAAHLMPQVLLQVAEGYALGSSDADRGTICELLDRAAAAAGTFARHLHEVRVAMPVHAGTVQDRSASVPSNHSTGERGGP